MASDVGVTMGPWRRIIDQARAGQSSPDALRDLVDGIIGVDGAILSRPGFATLAAHPGAPGQAQGIAGMELAGTLYTFAVVGGVLASYDWTADAWTTLAHTGTAINVTGPVALVPYFDQLVVSDGVNRPWSYTPGSGVGTYLGMSDGPWFGPPTVKDAKLFAIQANERRTIVWSEEADLTIGGAVPPYNDAWDLRQTSQAAIVALRGTNTSLFYLRERSTGQILGSVGEEFQASGSHDDVATTVGTLSPSVPVVTDAGTLWALDALGKPYRVRAGNDPDDLWLACEATIATVDRDRLGAAWGLFVPDLDAVLFAVPRTAGNLYNTDLLLFDRPTGDYVGRWQAPGGPFTDFAWGGLAVDDAGIERLVLLDHNGTAAVCWRLAEADADVTKAIDVSGDLSAIPATRAVLPDASAEGADDRAWVQWTEVTVETGDPRGGSVPPRIQAGTGTTCALDFEDPTHAFGSTAPLTVTVPTAGRRRVGLKRFGRYLRVAIAAVAGAGSQRFQLRRVTLVGQVRDTAANRR